MTPRCWLSIAAAFLLAGCTAGASNCVKDCPTAARRDENLDRCLKTNADVRSCTVLLESGQVPAEKRFMIYVNRSGGYIASGQYDKAIADCDEAIRLNPDFALSYYNRGLAYALQGHRDKAITEYDKAICLEPVFAEAYGNRGSVFSLEHKYDKAIADFDEVIRLKPDSGLAYYNRGRVKLAIGDRSGKGDIEKAKELGYEESSN